MSSKQTSLFVWKATSCEEINGGKAIGEASEKDDSTKFATVKLTTMTWIFPKGSEVFLNLRIFLVHL